MVGYVIVFGVFLVIVLAFGAQGRGNQSGNQTNSSDTNSQFFHQNGWDGNHDGVPDHLQDRDFDGIPDYMDHTGSMDNSFDFDSVRSMDSYSHDNSFDSGGFDSGGFDSGGFDSGSSGMD